MASVKAILDTGMRFLGQPYVWGGSSPKSGFDCSGLMQWIFAQNGVRLPRVSADQARIGRAVSMDQAQPGDLIAFDNSSSRPGVDHIGVYLGDGKMLQAPRTGRNIEVVNVDLRRAATIRRVAGDGPDTYAGLTRTREKLSYGAKLSSGAAATAPTAIDYRSGGSDPLVKPVDPEEAIASYGYIADLAGSVPDVKRTLERAIAQGWTPTRFTAEIQKTAWWKATSDSQRQGTVMRETNPGEWKRQITLKRQQATALAYQLGASLDSKRLDQLSEQAVMQGWSAQEMQRYVVADVKFVGGTGKGQAGVTMTGLKDRAAEYLVNPTAAVLQKWTKDILNGYADENGFDTYLKQQAKALFPTLAAAIDSGVTVSQYVEPYRQLAAQTLELPEESINFSDARFRDPLFAVNKTTGERGTMSLSDYAKHLRQQPEYRKTAAAKEQTASLGNMFGQMFGKVA